MTVNIKDQMHKQSTEAEESSANWETIVRTTFFLSKIGWYAFHLNTRFSNSKS